MKKTTVLLSIMAILLFTGNTLAANITIFDGSSSGSGWYGTQEDEEVEPGCVSNQSWDLEAFLFEGNKLSMVGGYDFVNGRYGSGDIFIDTNGQYYDYDGGGFDNNLYPIVDHNNTALTNFGYEWAIQLDFSAGIYAVL